MMDKGKYDLTTVIGVTVSVIAFILILVFKPGMPKNVPEADKTPEAPAVSSSETQAPSAEPQAATSAAQEPQSDALPKDGILKSVSEPFRRSASTPARIGGGDFQVDVSTEGNGITAAILGKYMLFAPRQSDDNAPVVLADADYPFLALSANGMELLVDGDAAKNTENEVVLVRKSADGKIKLTEKWAVSPESQYELAYTANIENLSGEKILLHGYRLEGSAIPTSVTPDRKAGRGESAGGASVSQNGKVKDYSLKVLTKLKAEERSYLATNATAWAAVHSKYFVMAFWMNDCDFAGMEVAAVPSERREAPSVQSATKSDEPLFSDFSEMIP